MRPSPRLPTHTCSGARAGPWHGATTAGAEQRLAALATPREALPLRVAETAARLMLAEVRLRQQRWHDAEQLARPALAHVRESPLRERFSSLEAEAALRLGQALHGAGDDRAACSELARTLQLRAASDGAGGPWLAEVERAASRCEPIHDTESSSRAAHGGEARYASSTAKSTELMVP